MTRLPPPNERLVSGSAFFLAATMAVAVLVMFVPRPWINPTLFQIGLFSLGLLWALAIVVRPFELRFSPVFLPLSGAVAWGLLQLTAGWTSSRSDTAMATLAWAGNLVAFFLAMQVCRSWRIRRRFMNTLLYFGFVLSIVSVLQYFSGEGRIFWVFQTDGAVALGPFVNRDQYSAFIEMVLPLALVETLDGGSRAIRFAVIAAALYASVIAGASRAGALLVTAEIVVVPLILWARGRMRPGVLRSATLNVWLLAFVFAAVAGYAVLWNRFEDPDPLLGRREMLSGTVAMVKAKPYAGFGLGTFRTVYPAYSPVDFGSVVNHAHNDWAEWAADGGIPFSLLMLAVAVWGVPAACKTVWGVGLVAVFLHSLVDFPLQKPVLELWMFALLGALAAATNTPAPQEISPDPN